MAPHATYPYTGRFVLRLTGRTVERMLDALEHNHALNLGSLREVACALQLTELCHILTGEYPGVSDLPAASDVPLADLLELERRAQHTHFWPIHSLLSYYIVDPRSQLRLTEAEQLFQRLLRLDPGDGVDLVYREPELRDPGAVNPGDDTYASEQGYLRGGTGGPNRYKGINADNPAVWGAYDGGQVGFVDLERGWNVAHEDLPAAAFPVYNSNIYSSSNAATGNHGTAVLGVVLGVDNSKGIVGVAPGAQLRRLVSRVQSSSNQWDLVNAILAALAPGVMTPGDVLLIEVETTWQNPIDGYPVEIADLWFDAIRLAVGNGIVVVEAAGNGSSDATGREVARDLDHLELAWPNAPSWRSMNRLSPKFVDSGAIMVSACSSTVEWPQRGAPGVHRRMNWATFGSRIDCYAWGENVYTAGYGDTPPGDPALPNTWYTNSFSGTSAASAIVAGAALLVQDMHVKTQGWRLSPAQIRVLLADKQSGVEVLETAGMTHAGVMPDLAAIAGRLGAVPDVFIRDSVADTGTVPSGSVTMSPDIIVRNQPIPNASATLGETGPWVNLAPPLDPILIGQPNYVYVRLRNRSVVNANGVTVRLYWSEASPLAAPYHWHAIGKLTGIVVPAGGALTVAGPYQWTPAAGKVAEPACFIAIADHPLDPRPPFKPAATSWTKFLNYVRRNNNVARRNFAVLVPQPSQSGWAVDASFVIRGSDDESRKFSFELLQRLSDGIRVSWRVPPELAAMLRRGASIEAEQQERDGAHRLLFRRGCRLELGSLLLHPDTEYPCTLQLEFPESLALPADNEVVLRQVWRSREVGRLTWTLGPGGEQPR